MASFTFAFPMKLNSGGRIATDETPDSQVRVIAHTEINQRIDDREYGFPPYAYEQAALADEIRRPITLVMTQRALLNYISNMHLEEITVERDRANRRLAMQIKYRNRNRIERGEGGTQFGLGLEEV